MAKKKPILGVVPDVNVWYRNYATVEHVLRRGLDKLLGDQIACDSKYGPRSAPAVFAAIVATTNFDRLECHTTVKQLAHLVDVDPVTVIGATKILESSGLVIQCPLANRYYVSDLREQRRLDDDARHPFEESLWKVFDSGRAGRLRGSALMLYVVVGHLARFCSSPFETSHEELTALCGFTPHTLISALGLLGQEKLIHWSTGARTNLELILPKPKPDHRAEVQPTQFVQWLSRCVEGGVLNGTESTKSRTQAWSCALAVASLQYRGTWGYRPTHADVERVLYGGARASRGPMAKALEMTLIVSESSRREASGGRYIKVLLDNGWDREGRGTGDRTLVLTTLLAWGQGLIREISVPALRAQLAALRESNLTTRPFGASNREFETLVGMKGSGNARMLRKLRSRRLLETTGKRQNAKHVLCLPQPAPGNGRWLQRYQEIVKADDVIRASDTRRDNRTMFCSLVAWLLDECRRRVVPIKRVDLVVLLHIGSSAGFDPDNWVSMSGRSLTAVGVSVGRESLTRLVAAGYLDVNRITGNRADRYRLLHTDAMQSCAAAEDARTFTTIVERLVTPRDGSISQGTKPSIIAEIPIADLWLYATIAVALDFQISKPKRISSGELRELSGVSHFAFLERIDRLECSGLVRQADGRHGSTLALMFDNRAGTRWAEARARSKPRSVAKTQSPLSRARPREMGMVIDEKSRDVRWNGKRVVINPGEQFEILCKLHGAHGAVVRYRDLSSVSNLIAESVNISEATTELRASISRIRSALKVANCTWKISVVRSNGYRLLSAT